MTTRLAKRYAANPIFLVAMLLLLLVQSAPAQAPMDARTTVPSPPSLPPPPPAESSLDAAPANPPAASSETDRQQTVLTRTAQSLARRGQCDVVAAIGARVVAMDAEYYEHVFWADPDIARCQERLPSPASRDLAMTPRDLPTAPRDPSTAPRDPSTAPRDPSTAPRDPSTALWLSLGMTLGGVGLIAAAVASHDSAITGMLGTVGALGVIAGPSLGHVYAGRLWNRGLELRLYGLGTAAIGWMLELVVLYNCIDGRCPAAYAFALYAGAGHIAVGGLAYFGGTVHEIFSAPSAARRYNSEHGIGSSVMIVPFVTRSATGLSLSARF